MVKMFIFIILFACAISKIAISFPQSSTSLQHFQQLQGYNCKIEGYDFFSTLDVPADGSCQFHAIATALNLEPEISKLCKFDESTLRSFAASRLLELSDDDFQLMLVSYQVETDFIGRWNPNDVKTREQLAFHLEHSGSHYWGDQFTLMLLQRFLQVNFLVFSASNSTWVSMLREDSGTPSPMTIILWFHHLHYRLIVGRISGENSFRSVFTDEEVKEIKNSKDFKSCLHIKKSRFENPPPYNYRWGGAFRHF